MSEYKLEIFCEPDRKDEILSLLHHAEVDRIGHYDHCWALSLVDGSHRAREQANPLFGEKGKVENYPLLKVEINVDTDQIKPLIKRLKSTLKWEEPVINIFKLYNNEFDL